MTADLRTKLIQKGWVTEFNADTLTRLIEEHYAALAEPEPEGSTDEALASFTAWFCRNYPGPDTVICRPEWHAPRVFRAAAHAIARWGRQTAPPAEGEVAELVAWLRDHAYVLNPSAERKARRICVLLQHQALPGVAVSERLPGPEDWDAEGRCWWFIPASVMPNGTCPCWCLAPAESPRPWFTHWRPANALPIPQQQESDNG